MGATKLAERQINPVNLSVKKQRLDSSITIDRYGNYCSFVIPDNSAFVQGKYVNGSINLIRFASSAISALSTYFIINEGEGVTQTNTDEVYNTQVPYLDKTTGTLYFPDAPTQFTLATMLLCSYMKV